MSDPSDFSCDPFLRSPDRRARKHYSVTAVLLLLCKYINKWRAPTRKSRNVHYFYLNVRRKTSFNLSVWYGAVWSHSTSVREWWVGVITALWRGVEHLSSVRETEKRHGCDLLNAGHPRVLFRQHGGHLAQCWGLHPLSRAVSCAALKHCLHILMLIRQEAGADVKHLVLFLFTCKEIMWPLIISLSLSLYLS